MEQALQLDLPFCREVVEAWCVPLGADTGLKLDISLTRSGAECVVTHTFTPRVWLNASGDFDEFDTQTEEIWRLSLNLKPPAGSEFSRHSFTEEDLPVPGDGPVLPWNQQPLVVMPLAMVLPDLTKHGRLDEILAASRALGLMGSHLESCWEERGLKAARHFPRAWGMRWYVYREATNDETGRVAQMAEVCPGLLILCKALADRDAKHLADRLLEFVVRGHKLGKVLDAALLAWIEAQKQQPCWSNYPEDEENATQRLRIRRAPPELPPSQLWAGVPGLLAAEDVPPVEAERQAWFNATTGIWVKRARERLSPEQLFGLFRFLSHNWRWAQPGNMDSLEWAAYMDHVVDYLAYTRRILRRRSSPRRLVAQMARWEEELCRRNMHFPPETPLETHGLERWQGERAWLEPIRTAGALLEESRNMGHCVAAYASWAVPGEALYVHGEIDGAPVTVELKVVLDKQRFLLGEVKGLRNRGIRDEERTVIRAWLAELGNPKGIGVP